MIHILEIILKSHCSATYPIVELYNLMLIDPVIIESGETLYIGKGDRILIENGYIKNYVNYPTHEIIRTYSKSVVNFYIEAVDLRTGEIITIKY
jgi:hypothetical protein